ncbi:MAG: glucosaminidase domain-containing protein [Paludibacteraceae bacterium]|nr:glucosaminidase domain-containing protein [Paludibacteraceae bacterium]
MKKYTLIIALCTWVMALADVQNPAYLQYIQIYKQAAVNQEVKHGIPACITLAQGLLESGAGRSILAVEANNHFGIKCHDWTGETMHWDDDRKNDCFRKYATVDESYEDHAKFLLRPRYSSLFELDVTDYKGWAKGLKQCGYATDPQYANKLVKIIEDYGLAQINGEELLAEEARLADEAEKALAESVEAQEQNKVKDESLLPVREVDLYIGHMVKREKGKRYVVAEYGDTYEAIAAEYKIEVKRILRYNNAKKGDKPKAGTKVRI